MIDSEQVAAGSLLDLMNKHVDLAYGDLTVEASAAQAEHADYLGLMPGDPILTRSLIYYDANDRAVMTGISYYRADQVRYSLHVSLKKQKSNKNEVIDKLQIKKP
jgi:GntR family transcriptional regulator